MTPRAVVVQEVLHLSPEAPEEIARRLGMTVHAIMRSLYRAGRPDLAAPFAVESSRARRRSGERRRYGRVMTEPCVRCHETGRKHHGLGLCKRCYGRMRRGTR